MTVTWIVAANAGRARIFARSDGHGELREVADMINSAVRQRNAELPHGQIDPRSASGSGHGAGAPGQPSGYQPQQMPDQHQTELFARDVAAALLTALHLGQYQQLVITASPEFLGVLRQVIDQRIRDVISEEINKDYTQLSPAELRGLAT